MKEAAHTAHTWSDDETSMHVYWLAAVAAVYLESFADPNQEKESREEDDNQGDPAPEGVTLIQILQDSINVCAHVEESWQNVDYQSY